MPPDIPKGPRPESQPPSETSAGDSRGTFDALGAANYTFVDPISGETRSSPGQGLATSELLRQKGMGGVVSMLEGLGFEKSRIQDAILRRESYYGPLSEVTPASLIDTEVNLAITHLRIENRLADLTRGVTRTIQERPHLARHWNEKYILDRRRDRINQFSGQLDRAREMQKQVKAGNMGVVKEYLEEVRERLLGEYLQNLVPLITQTVGDRTEQDDIPADQRMELVVDAARDFMAVQRVVNNMDAQSNPGNPAGPVTSV